MRSRLFLGDGGYVSFPQGVGRRTAAPSPCVPCVPCVAEGPATAEAKVEVEAEVAGRREVKKAEGAGARAG